ncbi:hypothetical protein THF5G08_90213 [Vibrio jasicida]|nr:hypothetical protein THF5G08_90213 [Vibrio jasicida]
MVFVYFLFSFSAPHLDNEHCFKHNNTDSNTEVNNNEKSSHPYRSTC